MSKCYLDRRVHQFFMQNKKGRKSDSKVTKRRSFTYSKLFRGFEKKYTHNSDDEEGK